MLRLNMAIAPCTSTARPLGVIGGDMAGFPNGRRLSDDIIDVALRVVMGVLAARHRPGVPTRSVTASTRTTCRSSTAFPTWPTRTPGRTRIRSLDLNAAGGAGCAPRGPGRPPASTADEERADEDESARRRRSAGACAVALFVAGGIGRVPVALPGGTAPGRSAAGRVPSRGRAAGAAGGGRLRSLRRHDRAALQAPPARRCRRTGAAFASLGLAYVQQARVTGRPQPLPEGRRACSARSLALQRDDNDGPLVGMAALAAARHDFAAALRLGRHALGDRSVRRPRLRRDR